MKLNAKQRKAIYGLVTAGAVALVAFNLVSIEQISELTNAFAVVVGGLTTLLAYLNTNEYSDYEPEDDNLRPDDFNPEVTN